MGFFSRLLVPRSVRRAAHPLRTTRRALTPKPIKRARRALSPVSNAKYSVEREVGYPASSGGKKRARSVAYTHGSCQVRHRTPEAAAKCRNR